MILASAQHTHGSDMRFVALVLGALSCVRGARILVAVPTPSFSHQVVFRPLTLELARRGHQLVVLTTDPAAPDHPNITEIDLHDSYALWIERFIAMSSGKTNDKYEQIRTAYEIMLEIFEKQMRLPAIAKLLSDHEQRFDLVLAEAWVRPTLALGHRFRAPVVLMSSIGATNEQYEDMGLPGYSFLYVDFFRNRIYNLTLYEEAKELYSRYRLNQLIKSYQKKEDVMLRRVFGAETPPLSELKQNIELLFVNEPPQWDLLRPTPPGVVYLNGMHAAPAQEIPKELAQWMDASECGVIYVSFGTNTDPALLPAARVAVFTRVLAALPYDVLWRWRDPPPLPPNVRAAAWLPQADLLRHEKLVLFVTQAGLQSTDEALRAGVPLLAVPMLADQWFNAEQLAYYGAARQLDLYALTDAQLQEAILALIHDKSYRESSAALGAALCDQPQSSLTRAVLWTERVLCERGRPRALPAPPAQRLLPLEAAAALAALCCVCKFFEF